MNFQRLLLYVAAAVPLAICSVIAHGSNPTRFAILSDIHVTPGNPNEDYLRKAVDEINALSPDVVIVDGDLTNEGSDEQLSNVKAILDILHGPVFTLPGNHENNWSQSATKTFIDLWGNDRFVGYNDSLLWVGINCGPFMKMGDGHVKQEDLHWLKHTLDSLSPGRQVISFNHYPLSPDLDNYRSYLDLLRQYPVIAHVNGHYHVFRQYVADDINSIMVGALDQGDKGWGYSLIDVTPDSVVVWRKIIGKEPVREGAWAISIPDPSVAPADHAVIIDPKADGFVIEKIWTDSASIFTRTAQDSSRIYFGTSLGDFKAVGKSSGSLAWQLPTGASLFARPSVASSGIVVVPAASREILFVNASTGQIRGSRQSEGPYVADGIVVADTLYQGGYKKMEKWDIKNGCLIWQYDDIDNYCQASPVLDGDDLIFGAWDTNLYCLDSATGALRWKWNNGKKANMLGPGNVVPVVTPDQVIIVAPDRYMTSIDRKSGSTRWRNKSYRYRESLGVSADRTRAYAKTMDGELVAVDLTVPYFEKAWVTDMGIGYDHAPCIIAECDGVVYAGSRRGILTALDALTGKVLWSQQLGVSEINGIDIDPTAPSDLYVSLIEGTVYRISRR